MRFLFVLLVAASCGAPCPECEAPAGGGAAAGGRAAGGTAMSGGSAGGEVSGGGGAGGGVAASGGTSGGGRAGGNATAGGTTGGGSVAGGAGAGGRPGGGSAAGGSATAGTLSAQYPGDVGIGADPRVLFATGFENGMTGWTSYTTNPQRQSIVNDAARANGGAHFLEQRITRAMLQADTYVGVNAQYEFSRRVPEVYWRFYARVVGNSARPHHWVRVAAGTPSYQSDGLANTVPPGNQGFWFDVDMTSRDTFNFYVYWYRMRSGRCNDGSATPGCAGDQGTTYYYGNVFDAANQPSFSRDQWFCFEVRAKANTVGTSDGELTLWKDGVLVADYRPGTPRGRWLRATFFSWGQYYQDLQAFEGFDFRSDANVLLKRVTLDAYFQNDTLPASAPQSQVFHYDDVVVATSRIGCRVP